jgi:hypothetical protein
MNPEKKTTGYEVRYGRPPLNSSFKKRQSGNPIGRRRGFRVTAQGAYKLGSPMLQQVASLIDVEAPLAAGHPRSDGTLTAMEWNFSTPRSRPRGLARRPETSREL